MIMAFQAKCDIGGETEDTDGTVIGLPILGNRPRPALPDGWHYVTVPVPSPAGPSGIANQTKVVCPACMMRVWRLFGVLDGEEPTDRCVRCPHSAFKHRGSRGCQECDCELSEVESTDPGWARS